MFSALGRLAARRPWYVIAAWVVFTILVTAFAPKVNSTTNQADFLPHHYESVQATQILQKAFPAAAQQGGATIVFDRADNSALTPTDLTKIDRIAGSLGAGTAPLNALTPPTKGAGGHFYTVAPDGKNRAAIVNLNMADGHTGQAPADYNQIKDLRDKLASAIAGTNLHTGVTGTLAQTYDQSQSGNNAEIIVGLATVLLIVVLLSVIFRSVLITLLPILLVGFFLTPDSNGLIDFAAKAFNLQKDDSTSVILIVVLFGVGTDYILFFLFRYRERMRQIGQLAADKAGRRQQHRDAVAYAVERAGEAIVSAGGAVFVAFMTLALSSLGIFKSIGPSLAIAVAVTLVAAVTLVPAIVSVIGTPIFWPSKKWRTESRGARFAAIGAAVGRKPARFAVASGGALLILAIFALGFHPTFDLGSSQSAKNVESAVATQTMESKGFSAGATEPTPIVLTSASPIDKAKLTSYAASLKSVPGVAAVEGAAVTPSDPKTAVVELVLNADPTSQAAINIVRNDLRPAAHANAPAGTTAYVGGTASVFVDFQSAMNRDYKVVFPVAAAIILIILMLVLRSLVAPWYLMVSVGLGFAATLGATVIVFQHIKGDGGLIFLLPIYIYLFVVALGTDYNILMVTRLREEAREGRSPREAAAEAVRHAGPTVGAAGLILAGTFASLMLAGNSLLLTMGFAISFGIAVAAFIMAMFFTPSLTALIGHAAWWPGHGDEKRDEPEKELTRA